MKRTPTEQARHAYDVQCQQQQPPPQHQQQQQQQHHQQQQQQQQQFQDRSPRGREEARMRNDLLKIEQEKANYASESNLYKDYMNENKSTHDISRHIDHARYQDNQQGRGQMDMERSPRPQQHAPQHEMQMDRSPRQQPPQHGRQMNQQQDIDAYPGYQDMLEREQRQRQDQQMQIQQPLTNRQPNWDELEQREGQVPRYVREHQQPKGYPQHEERQIEPSGPSGGYYVSSELEKAQSNFNRDRPRAQMQQQQMHMGNPSYGPVGAGQYADSGRIDPEGCLLLIRFNSDRGDNVRQCKKFCVMSKSRIENGDKGKYIGVCEHVYCKEIDPSWPTNMKKSVLALWFESYIVAEEWLNCDKIFKQQDCMGGIDVLAVGVKSRPKMGQNVLLFQVFVVRDAFAFKNNYSAEVGSVIERHNGQPNIVCTVHTKHLRGYWPIEKNAFVQIHAFRTADDVVKLHQNPDYKRIWENARASSSSRTIVFPLDPTTSPGPQQVSYNQAHHQQQAFRH